MYNIPKELSDKLCAVLSEEVMHNLQVCFRFNLKCDNLTDVCNGVIAADKENLYVVEDGQIKQIVKVSEIKELITDMGVGCVFVSYIKKQDNSVNLLCRSDGKFINSIIKSVKDYNYFLENGRLLYKEDSCSERGKQLSREQKKQLFKKVWELLSPHKVYLIIAFISFFVMSAINLIAPILNRIAVDDYIKSPNPEGLKLGNFALIILSMFLIECIVRGINMVRTHLLICASSKMTRDLRNRLFSKVESLSITKISKYTTGDLLRRVMQDTQTFDAFVVSRFPNIIEELTVMLAVSVYILFYDPILFLFIMLPTPLVVLFFYLFRKKMRSLFRRNWSAASKTNSVLHDIFSGIRVVKSFGTEYREGERFREFTGTERVLQEKIDCIWSIIMPILRFFISFGEFILLFYVGNKILGGSMTLGEMSQFSFYITKIYGPLRMISMIPRQVMEFTTSSSKIFEVLDEEADITESENPQNPEIKGNIDINNISFGYDIGKEVLKNVDIHIKPGEFIGLVGASGVGKTTLINLIMRLYDVESGSITVDGVDIRNISSEALRKQIGVVLQETYLFSGTVFQNIAYAKPDATRDEVISVSKLAGCHEFIKKMPDGYNTKIGEKGLGLSGGERQRVAIARALLHNPKILILDEATASLDTETEKQIQDALARLSKQCTTIAIAHRLSTLRNATKLVVLDKGTVAEIGTHDELVAKQGIYYGLVMAQRQMSNIEIDD